MPIYEFYCPENHTVYQFLARSLAFRDKQPQCPDNPAYTLQKQVSRFAIVGKAKAEAADGDPFAGMSDEQVEALMNSMEGEMGAMDEDNPDPRQMGRLMRKMTEVMGDKAPAQLRELVKRLESGEDPEKLEADFGDLDENCSELFSQMKKIIGHSRAPARNPKLYEMSEWVK